MKAFTIIGLLLWVLPSSAAQGDSAVYAIGQTRVVVHHGSGKIDYGFSNGAALRQTVAYAELVGRGVVATPDFNRHTSFAERFSDSLGTGMRIAVSHTDDRRRIKFIQYLSGYDDRPHLQLRAVVVAVDTQAIESRHISPLAVLPEYSGSANMPGHSPRLVDAPFDNDNWVKLLVQPWPKPGGDPLEGVSHEFAAVYDSASVAGMVVGSLEHDCWKTGIAYRSGADIGALASFVVYGGAARPDNPLLAAEYGGYDGTHDYMAHGTLLGDTLRSPLIYVEAGSDVRQSLANYGREQARLAGASTWNGPAPVYWNSFGVEGVLGHERVMMPRAVHEVSDFIQGMRHFSAHGQPVLSIDSYDQEIYSTAVLREIGEYGASRGQQLGFYCCPFSLWTWKDNIDHATLPGSGTPLRDVILRDEHGRYIPYKDGEWGAFPLDPTHPATRMLMIQQLEKAEAVGARFIKIDFLTAGSLESAVRYDPRVRTGMQAYDYGMKLFRQLIDSIMGPDVFITQAISPMFPHQYAHTRFVSTDVHSHLRDSQPGFPHYGSTAASMITASHMGWVQGTLWPYTNMDVLVMKQFQKHPPLSETEVKVRLYCLMVMGSILGDGSDYRDKAVQDRAHRFLDHPEVARFFRAPRAFTPLKLAEGADMDQRLSFFLRGDTVLAAAFNFHEKGDFDAVFDRRQLGVGNGNYRVVDFLTGESVADFREGNDRLHIAVSPRDARLVKLILATPTD